MPKKCCIHLFTAVLLSLLTCSECFEKEYTSFQSIDEVIQYETHEITVCDPNDHESRLELSSSQIYNAQDRPSFALNNPLKGLSRFVFFVRFPAPSKKAADKISAIVERELRPFGKVSTPELLIQTEEGEAIDLSKLGGGVTLLYDIENVVSPERKDLGIMRASLNLSTHVQIQKTKELCTSYIWSVNCFLKGSAEKNLDRLVTQSFRYLLTKFQCDYNAANSTEPSFDLYTQ